MVHNKLQLPFLLLLLAGILLISYFILKPFFAPLALAIVFSVVFYPVYKNLLSYFREKEGLAALMTLTLSAVCILIPFIVLGSQIVNEAINLYNSTITGTHNQNLLITLITSIGNTVGNILPATGPFFTNLADNVDVYVNQGLSWLIKHIGTALSSVSSLLLSFFIFFISFYYLLRDGKKLKHAIITLSPLDDKDDTIIFDRLESAVNSVIKGSLFIALIQGILTAIGFTLFGIPNSILWGTVTVIAALIPGLGTALIILPAVAYLFITGNPLQASHAAAHLILLRRAPYHAPSLKPADETRVRFRTGEIAGQQSGRKISGPGCFACGSAEGVPVWPHHRGQAGQCRGTKSHPSSAARDRACTPRGNRSRLAVGDHRPLACPQGHAGRTGK